LKVDEQRFNKLDSSVNGLDSKLDEMIQEWFVHMSSQTAADVPVEGIHSIQDVIADNSAGLAMNRMRVELDEIRGSLDSSRHVMESLRGLVVDLSNQVTNSSIHSTMIEPEYRRKIVYRIPC